MYALGLDTADLLGAFLVGGVVQVERCEHDAELTVNNCFVDSIFCVEQDAQAACSTYQAAVEKLQASTQFVRGDVAPHNAVGDAYVSWAERVSDNNAMQHLQSALDHGYQAALHINASCTEALIGIGEVHSKMGKLCQRNGSNDADPHLHEAARAFERALQSPANLGSFQDRCETRYNYACLLALCKRPGEAINVLAELLKCQGVTAHDLVNDSDFGDIRSLPAFQHLIEQAKSVLTSA